METMLTYAVPVHVAELGANLQAWIDTLRPIQSLRLCHRFGGGDTAPLVRLPTELLARIESCLVNAVRQQYRPEWELDLRCYKNVCTPLEHFSWDEQILIYAKYGTQEMGTRTNDTPCGPRTTLELSGDGRSIRALRILDLEVFVHRSQQAVSLGVPRPENTGEGSGTKRRPYAADQWPQLCSYGAW